MNNEINLILYFNSDILILILVIGCGRHNPDDRLVEIEGLSDIDPSLALTRLDSIDKESLDEYNRHYYDFLKLKESDKAYKVHTSDSLYLSVLNYFNSRKSDPIYPEVLYYGGRVYSEIGDCPRALKFFQDVLPIISDKEDNLQFRLNVLSQLGRLLGNLKMYDEAIPYLEECIRIDTQQNDTNYLHYDYLLLANVARNTKNYKKAEIYLKKAIELTKNKPDSIKAYMQSQLALLKRDQKEKDSALYLIRGVPEKVGGINRDYVSTIASGIYQSSGINDTAYMYAHVAKDSPINDWKRCGYELLLSSGIREFSSQDTLDLYLENFLEAIKNKYDENARTASVIQNSRFNYYRYEKENNDLIEKRNRLLILLTIALVCLLISFVIILLLKYRNARIRIDYYIAYEKIKELQLKLKDGHGNDGNDNEISPHKLSLTDSIETIRKQTLEEKKLLMESIKLNPISPSRYIGTEGLEVVCTAIKESKNIPEKSKLWDKINVSFDNADPLFWETLRPFHTRPLKQEEKNLLILIRYGIIVTHIAKILSVEKGSITYRRKQLMKLLFSDLIPITEFDNLIRSL